MTEPTTADTRTPIDQLSMACIDATSQMVEWDPQKMLDDEWGYHQAFTYTLGTGDDAVDVVLVADGAGVKAVFTADGERIDLGYDAGFDEYLEANLDDEGQPLPGSLTEAQLEELRDVEPHVYGGEGPMMNFFYPLNEQAGDSIGPYGDTVDEVEAAYRLRHLPLCVVERDGDLGLALTGGGMDLTWEICAAYIALGYLPPVAYSDLPGMSGRPRAESADGGADARVIAAVHRSLSEMAARMQRSLDRHDERYPQPRPPAEADESEPLSPIAKAAARLNQDATFYPVTDDYTLPCIEIAGAQVYFYIDPLGRVRVSVDTEGTGLPARADSTTPMIICLNEAVVLDDSGEEGVPLTADRMTLGDSNPFAQQFLDKFVTPNEPTTVEMRFPDDPYVYVYQVPRGSYREGMTEGEAEAVSPAPEVEVSDTIHHGEGRGTNVTCDLYVPVSIDKDIVTNDRSKVTCAGCIAELDRIDRDHPHSSGDYSDVQ